MRGVLVRHLVMPGLLDDTREIMRWIATALSRDTYVNVMNQYYPAHKAETEPRFAQINRRLHDSEFEQALEHARRRDYGGSIDVAALPCAETASVNRRTHFFQPRMNTNRHRLIAQNAKRRGIGDT